MFRVISLCLSVVLVYPYTVRHFTRLHLHFQVPDRAIGSDPRVRVLVDVSPFPGLVDSYIWCLLIFSSTWQSLEL